jgi:Adaptin N terminal region
MPICFVLQDPDVSIRRRAMELSFQLVVESNLETMTRELLAFLNRSEPEVKSVCASNLVSIAERYAPSPSWHFHTLFEILQAVNHPFIAFFPTALLITYLLIYLFTCHEYDNDVF